MPHQLRFPLLLLASQLDQRLWEIEAASFPEVTRLASRPAVEPLLESLRRRLQRWPAAQWASRILPDSKFERVSIPLLVPPARNQKFWTQPFQLNLWAVKYQVAGLGWILALPHLLGLDIVAEDEEQLVPKAQAEILSLLKRDLGNYSLEKMVELSRYSRLRIGRTNLKLSRPSLHQLEQPNLGRTKSLLDEVGQKIDPQKLRPTVGRSAEISEVLDHLTANEPLSVALIGPAGCGKTAVFSEAVRQFKSQANHKNSAHTAFYQTTASSLMAGQSGFGAWQQRCQDVMKAALEQKAIVHLGGLYELVQVGRHSTSPNGMAGVFRQREFISVVEATPQQWSQLIESHPHLLSNWQAVRLEAPNPEQVRQILKAHFPKLPRPLIEETAYLHQRWSALGAPRRPLRFLAALEAQPDDAGADLKKAISPARQAAQAFSKETGLPTLFLEEGEQFQTRKIQAWFEARVLGQSAAVQQVVDRLRTVKTALSRPGRPIANFLLMGPTGVGKTELARTLAEFVFQDRTRLTRFDMSEYSHPLAVSRLIGIPGNEQPGLLTSRVQEYPFQVVLFDELEKAHSDFFDLLLQILGDARLTDCHGEVADFSNCIILMTSNLGALEASKQSLGIRGSSAGGVKEKLYREAAQALFRPELINRLDGLIGFAPLSQEIVLSLATKLLKQLPERSAFQGRNIFFDISPDCAELLAKEGFDARYGARPLKRALDRLVLAPLAVELNRFRPELPLEISLSAPLTAGYVPGKVPLSAGTSSAPTGLVIRVRATSGLDEALAASREKNVQEDKISQLRRLVSKIEQGPLPSALQNQILPSVPVMRKKKLVAYRPDQLRRSAIASKVLDAWRLLQSDMEELEDLALLSHRQGPDPQFEQFLTDLAERLQTQLIRIWGAQESSLALSNNDGEEQPAQPNTSFLVAIYGSRPSHLSWLAKQYLAVIDAKPSDWRLQQILVTKGLHIEPTEHLPRPELTRFLYTGTKAVELLDNYKGIGLVLELNRSKALLALQSETGIHQITDEEINYRVQVELSDKPFISADPEHPFNRSAYQPPANIHRQGSIPKLQPRRNYTLASGVATLVEDPTLEWLLSERQFKQNAKEQLAANVARAFRLIISLSGLEEQYRQQCSLGVFIQARQLLSALEAGLD